MLRCIVSGCLSASHQVVAPMDERLDPEEILRTSNQQPSNSLGVDEQFTHPGIPVGTQPQDRLARWQQLAEKCDVTLVIAPEIDGILTQTVDTLRDAGISLINAERPFLESASNKWKTAQALLDAQLPHPATIRLGDCNADWLHQTSVQWKNTAWVVKPSDGAGCCGLHRMQDTKGLLAQLDNLRDLDSPHSKIVQPWIEGPTLSCSALAADDGTLHWMPLLTQEFTADESLEYIGCRTAPSALQSRFPTQILEQTVDALGDGAKGWLNFDLVHSRRTNDWVLIEVNPRCSTSIIPLANAYSCNLIDALLSSQSPGFQGLVGRWQAPQFDLRHQ